MYSRSLILVLLLACGICGQNNDNSGLNANNVENGYPFGKLRLSEDGKNEELLPSSDIELSPLNQDSPASSNVQPLPSPCVGITRPSTKLPFPKEKTKFIQCRDEYHYEILTCPEGVEYNEQAGACNIPAPVVNRCEREKPCLNDGQCSVLSNSTFKCACRPDWTGERCETPMNSCVKKPCGPNAECRTLKTSDYEQDYVCICHGVKGYGLNCREAVPNPCLTSDEQFFSYAFSQRAYIQCDGERVFFQPCGASLYWNQEDKICDRKRPTKTETPVFVKLPAESTRMNVNQQPAMETDADDELVSTTTMQTEQAKPLVQTVKQEKENVATFIPARVASRQQLLGNLNQQQNLREKELTTQNLANQLPQPAGTNSMRQEFIAKPRQWQTQQIDTTLRRPLTVQSGRFQPVLQNTQQQWTTTSTEQPLIDSDMEETQFQPSNQQQSFQQKNQAFGTQQWINQLPESNTQNNQRFVAQPQSWQTPQTFQNQQRVPEQQQQQTFVQFSQTTTTTTPQSMISVQSFSNQNTRDQEQTWRTRPNTFTAGNQFSQSWQNSQNRQPLQDLSKQNLVVSVKALPNAMHSQSIQNQNLPEHDESWEPESTNFVAQAQNWQNAQSSQTPQQVAANVLETISSNDRNRFNTGSQQTVQRLTAQPQSWQESQTFASQPQFQTQNLQVVETSTAAQNIVRLQGFQNQNAQDQEQTWQTKFQRQPVRAPASQVFAFKPTQWSETPKQDSKVSAQSWSQNQQPLLADSSSQMQNTQFTFNQQQQQQQPKAASVRNTFEQQQPWSNKQQLQKMQLSNFDDLKIQTTDDLTVRPAMTSETQSWSQNGQFPENNFETTTVASNGVFQGLSAQSQRGRVPFRAVEQNQLEANNQFGQQTVTEQRKPFNSIPTKLSGSWASRSS